MATEQETIELDLEDGVSPELKKLIALLDKYTATEDKAQAETEQLGVSTKGLGGRFAAFGLVMNGVNAGLDLLAKGISLVTNLSNEALQAANRYQGAEAQLNAALRENAKTADEYNKQKAEAIALSRELSKATGVEETEVQSLIARQLALGLSYKESAENASLALDIMARTGRDLKDSAEKLAKVRRGEVGDLAELVDLTKREQEALEKMTSAQEKTARMMAILRERFAGAKGEIQSSEVAVKNLTNAKTALLAELGKVIDESGVFQSVLLPVTELLYEQGDAVASDRKRYQLYAIEIGKRVVPVLSMFARTLNFVVLSAQYASNGLEMLTILAKSAGAVVASGTLLMSEAVVAAVARISDVQAKVLTTASQAAEALGQDDVARKLASWGKGVQASADDARKSIESMGESRAQFNKTIDGTGEALERVASKQGDLLTQAADRDRAIQDLEAKALANLAANQRRIASATNEATKTAVGGAKVRNKLRADSLALDSQAARQNALQLDVEKERFKLTKLTNEFEIINQKAIVARAELAVRLLGIQDARLKKQTEITELARIEQERTQGTTDALAKLRDEQKKRVEELSKALSESAAKRQEELDKARDGFDALISRVGALGDSQGIQGLASGLGLVNRSVFDAMATMKAFAKSSKEGGKAAAGALAQAGQGAAGFAQALGASATTQAVILAAFEQAAAIASFATGNILSGVQHQAAAIAFGAVAAMSAGGAGGGASVSRSGGTGAGATASAAASVDTGRTAREGAEMLAEVLADKLGNRGGGVYIDMRGAMVLDENAWFSWFQDNARNHGVNFG